MSGSRTTPEPGEYLLAYLASVGCFAVGLTIVAAFDPQDLEPGRIAAALFVATFYTTICSLPFAIAGIPVVHLLSRRLDSQAVQVAITGAVTVVVVGIGVSWVTASSDIGFAIGAGAAIATMVGRAAVIPLVRRPVKFHPWEVPYP